jgi:hypothetical protein
MICAIPRASLRSVSFGIAPITALAWRASMQIAGRPASASRAYMRDNWLSNRVFFSYENIVDHRCYAWNKLADQPWTIISIGSRDWA